MLIHAMWNVRSHLWLVGKLVNGDDVVCRGYRQRSIIGRFFFVIKIVSDSCFFFLLDCGYVLKTRKATQNQLCMRRDCIMLPFLSLPFPPLNLQQGVLPWQCAESADCKDIVKLLQPSTKVRDAVQCNGSGCCLFYLQWLLLSKIILCCQAPLFSARE